MNLKSIFMSMLAVAALASCNNNDDEIPGVGNQGEKASSWLGVSVSLPASAFSRAADGDTNADGVETAVETVSLYYRKTDGTVDALVTTLTAGDFDKADAIYTAKKAVLVPLKKGTVVDIYAAINAPAANLFKPNWFAFKGTAGDPNVNYWTVNSSELSNDNKFTMTGQGQGTTYATDTEAQKGTHVDIEIKRAVAKVLVTTSSAASFDPATDFEDKNPNGASGKFQRNSLKWTIGNNNKKIFLLADGAGKDPNWETLTGTPASLDDEYDNREPKVYDMLVPAYSPSIVTGYETGKQVQYCNENTNETYQYGNTSFISVQAEFVPTLIVKSVTGRYPDMEIPAETNDLGVATFYYNTTELKYFTADAYKKAVEEAYMPEKDFKGPYKDGKCHYFIPIKNGANELGVKRNTYYTMRINSLKAPGEPSSNPGGDIDPVEQNSWISVDFTVKNWDPQSMGDLDLE
jgi:lipoprotein